MGASTKKSEKELAFVQDLFVAPDWGERFAELIDEHVEIPKEGKAAYIAAGTGGHAIAIQQRAGEDLQLFCVDENEECLELARAKAIAAGQSTDFRKVDLSDLPWPANEFSVVIGDASLIPPRRVTELCSEMVRIAAPGATVALALPTASSFGEFFSIYWEALYNTGLLNLESYLEHLITELPAVSDVEQMAEEAGLEDVTSWTRVEEFDYDSADQFLNSPLVADFLLEEWLISVPKVRRNEVSNEISRLINEERHEAEFSFSVKATLVSGHKAHTN